MRVILLRHGIAHDRADPSCPPDPERELTDEGRKKVRKVARGLIAMGCQPTRILTSPYLRAKQTAELAAEEIGVEAAQITLSDALLPEAAPYALFQQLFAFHASDEEILCAGHAPNVDRVVAAALAGHGGMVTSMKKAGAALLLVDDLPRTRGSLEWLMPPKALAKLA